MGDDPGVVYTIDLVITDDDLDQLIRGAFPESIRDALFDSHLLGTLLMTRARFQRTPGENLKADREREQYRKGQAA